MGERVKAGGVREHSLAEQSARRERRVCSVLSARMVEEVDELVLDRTWSRGGQKSLGTRAVSGDLATGSSTGGAGEHTAITATSSQTAGQLYQGFNTRSL